MRIQLVIVAAVSTVSVAVWALWMTGNAVSIDPAVRSPSVELRETAYRKLFDRAVHGSSDQLCALIQDGARDPSDVVRSIVGGSAFTWSGVNDFTLTTLSRLCKDPSELVRRRSSESLVKWSGTSVRVRRLLIDVAAHMPLASLVALARLMDSEEARARRLWAGDALRLGDACCLAFMSAPEDEGVMAGRVRLLESIAKLVDHPDDELVRWAATIGNAGAQQALLEMVVGRNVGNNAVGYLKRIMIGTDDHNAVMAEKLLRARESK